MNPADLLPRFDANLAERSLRLEGVVIGGAALALMGLISRETRDCDLLEPPLDPTVAQAARDFARARQLLGEVLREDWLNNGPASLGPLLPQGWRDRLQVVYQGRAMLLWTLGRPELLLAKLFALCDRGLDLPDCLALTPTSEELAEAKPWVTAQDLNPDWPAHVEATFRDLARRLGHGL